MSRRWRIATVAVAAVVAFDVVLHVLGTLTGGTPGGPRSSSYSTGRTGVRAYAELLGRYGHPVERLRTTPSQSRLDPSDTVFLLHPPVVAAQDGVVAFAGSVGGSLFMSIDHPDERRPQCTHRRKIAPGSHHTPYSWRPDK